MLIAASLALAVLAAGAQAAEDDITVINGQSHPRVGGLWIVNLEASGGPADLAISGYQGTSMWGPGADVSFEYLRGPGGAVGGVRADNGVVFAGMEAGPVTFAVRVHSEGEHSLQVSFGDAKAHARNSAYPAYSSKVPGGLANMLPFGAGAEFGKSVAVIGDFDRNGVADMAVGVSNGAGQSDSRGAVEIVFMNSDGTARRTAQINSGTANGPALDGGDNFGASVSAMDLDGDGIQDIVVGAPDDDAGGASRGAVHVMLMNGDATVKSTAEINDATGNGPSLSDYDQFGSSVAGIGDLDGDGVPDVACGSPWDSTGGFVRGTVHIMFMNSDGSVKSTAEINSSTANGPSLSNFDQFGASVAGVGDLDGDGIPDIAGGANLDDAGGASRGAVHVMFMNRDGSVKSTAEINDATSNGPSLSNSDQFGTSVAGIGDVDGDGIQDIAVGAPDDDAGGANRGAVHVMFMNRDGSVKSTAEINNATAGGPSLSNNDKFGSALGSGDGYVVAGARGADAIGSNSGATYNIELNSDGTVRSAAEIGWSRDRDPRISAGDGFGSSVAGAGDFDGDGIPDIVVGAPGDDAGGINRGAVHAMFMNRDGTSRRTAEISGTTPNGPALANFDQFGASVAGVGDLDGDGIPDIAVGAPGDDSGGASRGAIHVMLMNRDGSVKSTAEINDGTAGGPSLANYDKFGASVSGIGDLDRDGIPDIAVGASGDDSGGSDRGTIHVMFMNRDGSVKRTVEINDGTAGGPALSDNDQFGASVAGIGDLDRDGIPDIVVGAPGDDSGGASRGAVHVMLMNRDGSVKSTAVINDGTAGGPSLSDNDQFGASVASIGDFDGDGVSDIVVGAPGDDSGGVDRGAVHVVFLQDDGAPSRTYPVSHETRDGPNLANRDGFGSSVAMTGDLDGDGIPDMMVGAPGDDSVGAAGGAAYAIRLEGSAARGNGATEMTASVSNSSSTRVSFASSSRFGQSVAGIRDLDGDGIPEVAAGAPGTFGGTGSAHVMFVGRDGTLKRITEISNSSRPALGLTGSASFGSGAAGIGDLDRDGIPDMVVGAEGAGSGSGSMFVLFLNSSGAAKGHAEIDETVANGPRMQSGDAFGASVAGIGDLDGDGVQDIAVGAPGDDSGGSDRGTIHVMFMNRDGSVKRTVEINDGTAGGPALSDDDQFGASVSGIGDLDRDGIPDIVSGAPGDDSGGASRGAVHVMLMNRDGSVKRTVETDDLSSRGPDLSNSDSFGRSAADAGDLDGDGVADLIIGAPGTASGSGAAHVLFMDKDATVLQVTSDAADGTYGQGSTIDIAVEFSEPVVVTGSPSLALETGALDGAASYRAGSGTSELTFRYVVGYGQRTADLDYASAGALGGGSVIMAHGRQGDAALDLPRPGSAGSLSYAKNIAVDAVRPEIGSTPPRLDLDGRRLVMSFDKTIAVAQIDLSGITLTTAPGAAPVSLAGAELPAEDSSSFSIGLTRAQKDMVALGMRAPGYASVSMDVSGSAIRDTLGNYYAGASAHSLPVDPDRTAPMLEATPEADFAAGTLSMEFDEMIDASGIALSGVRVSSPDGAASVDMDGAAAEARVGGLLVISFTDGQNARFQDTGMAAGGPLRLDVPASAMADLAGNGFGGLSGAAMHGHYHAPLSDAPAARDAARAHQSHAVATDAPAFSDYAGVQRFVFLLSDSPAASDSAKFHPLKITASDAPAVSDSARAHYSSVHASDAARPSDSASSYKSGAVAQDLPAVSDSAVHLGMRIYGAADSPAVSDSARAYRSGIMAQDLPAVSDSAVYAGMRIYGAADSPAASDSARAYRSGVMAQDLPAVSDSAASYKSRAVASDSPRISDSAYFAGMLSRTTADAPSASDSARAYKSGAAAADAPPLSDSVGARGMAVRVSSDTAVADDSARAYKSGVAGSDTPSLLDSAEVRGMAVRVSSDTAVADDSARAYKSGAAGADAPSVSDFVELQGASVRFSHDVVIVSDSTRAYKSGVGTLDRPSFADSAAVHGMSVRASSDTATVSDSARAYKSGVQSYDQPSLSDSAVVHGMGVRFSSDTAVVSDSARAYKSGAATADILSMSDFAELQGASVRFSHDIVIVSDSTRAYKSGVAGSDTPSLLDSAEVLGMAVRASADTATVSDSARAYKSGVQSHDRPSLSGAAAVQGMVARLSSDTAVVSDSGRAYKSAASAGDAPALSDSARMQGMAVRVSSDTVVVGDSARGYKSGVDHSDTPSLADSVVVQGMAVRVSSDTATVHDSALAYKSGATASGSPVVSDSVAFTGMLLQGISDSPPLSDSARAYRSSIALSDSPAADDSASGSGAFSAQPSDGPQASDSARAYKSGAAPSVSLAVSDSAQWNNMHAASVSDSPNTGDSARTYKSAAATGDAPVHGSGARAGKTTTSVSDSPSVSDAAAAGHPPVTASDLPPVSDGAVFQIESDAGLDLTSGSNGAGSGGGGGSSGGGEASSTGSAPTSRGEISRGGGAVGATTVAIHDVAWDRCSQDPHVLITAGPDCDNVTVTLSQQGGFTVAQITGVSGEPPGACTWRAPVSPQADEATIRAVHGRTTASDAKILAMEQCSGQMSFTAFAQSDTSRQHSSQDRSSAPIPDMGAGTAVPDVQADLARATIEEAPSDQRAEPTSEPLDLTAEPGQAVHDSGAAPDARVGQIESGQPGMPTLVGAAAVALVGVLAAAILRAQHRTRLRGRSASAPKDPR